MDLDYLVIADAAVVADGKHYIHGAGWDVIWATTYPAVHSALSVALRLRVPWGDTNQPHNLQVDVVDADAVTILTNPPGGMGGPVTTGRPPILPIGEDQVIPMTFTYAQVSFRAPGTYAVVVRIDGLERGRAPFRVSLPPGMMPGPAAP